MLGIIAFVLFIIVAMMVLAATAHLLFSPLVLVAIAVLVWLKFRPGRSSR
jgi:threonine/homoserine/homoserine lactone efflux protein